MSHRQSSSTILWAGKNNGQVGPEQWPGAAAKASIVGGHYSWNELTSIINKLGGPHTLEVQIWCRKGQCFFFFPLSFQRVYKEPTTSAHGSFWATDRTDLWTQQGFRVICVINPRYVHICTSSKNYYWQHFLSFYMLPIIWFLPDDAHSKHYDNKSCVYKVSLFLIFLYQHPCIDVCVCIYWFFIIKGPRLVPRGGHPKPSIFLQYSHNLTHRLARSEWLLTTGCFLTGWVPSSTPQWSSQFS